MTRYALLVHDRDDSDPPPAERMAEFAERVSTLEADMSRDGVWVFGMGLSPAPQASVVTADALVTDGPFAESREHVAGIWVVEVPDLATAHAWAARTAEACGAPIEVRPLHGA
ncbi:YciI family protein [Demequina sp. SO4-18]|uniref:YciI family protein n=1 Tax=Demequina sp. SO4-18 TaxID=3401026 RepID=UPI003B5B084D